MYNHINNKKVEFVQDKSNPFFKILTAFRHLPTQHTIIRIFKTGMISLPLFHQQLQFLQQNNLQHLLATTKM